MSRRILGAVVAVALVAGLGVLAGGAPAGAATVSFTVNDLGDAVDANTGDGLCATAGGACTLKAAVQQANAAPANTYTVSFSVAGTITTSGIGPILAPVALDGASAPGYSVAGGPTVTVRGGGASVTTACLQPGADDITIRGLRLASCSIAIKQVGGLRLKVVGNQIGNDGNAFNAGLVVNIGVSIAKADAVIGGASAADRNVISGFLAKGVLLGTASNNAVVRGNYLGTNATGTAAIKNPDGTGLFSVDGGPTTANAAVEAQAPGTVIQGNVIGGNPGYGVIVGQPGAQATLTGNLIGTNAAGTAGLANVGFGVRVQQGGSATIGGTAPGEGNVISSTELRIGAGAGAYDHGHGVSVDGSTATILGNRIGTNAAGTAALPNWYGVHVTGSSSGPAVGSTVTVGGTVAGAGNQISGNFAEGVRGKTKAGVVSSLTIQGNLVGTNAAGTAALSNGSGVLIDPHVAATIGGTAAGAGNVLSGNRVGVGVTDTRTGVVIQGNKVGTNAAGTAAIANRESGIAIESGGVTSGGTALVLGGAASGAGNVISGNAGPGLVIKTPATVQGNRIGTNAAGTSSIANTGTGTGVRLVGPVTIGGAGAGQGNVISGNAGNGIQAEGTGFSLVGNLVGVGANGTQVLPNGLSAVFVIDSAGGQIGGVGAGEGNTLANSPQGGVRFASSSNVVIRGNKIHHNTFPGIDLFQHDPQGKINGDQIHPTLTSVTASGGSTSITGTVTSDRPGPVLVDVYAGSRCTPKYGTGESEQYLGTISVPYAGGGVTTAFTGSVAAANPSFPVITATATVPVNGTSQYSTCAATSDLALTDQPNHLQAVIGSDVADKVTITNNGPTAVTGLVISIPVAAGPQSAVDVVAADAPSQGTVDVGAGTWNVGNLASGASATVCIRGDIVRSSYQVALPDIDPFDVPALFAVEGNTETSPVLDPYRGNNRNLGYTTVGATVTPGANVCPLPALSIDDASLVRPSTGTAAMTFTVRLPAAQTREVTVRYATSNGTAVAVEDYLATSGDLTIPAGQASKTFTVPIVASQSDEPDKAFTVTLSAPKHAKLGDATATGTVKANHVLGGCPPGSTSNQRFVCHLYFDALGRAPESGGFTYWVKKLNNGTPRSTMAKSYLVQPESLRKVADRAYVLYLGRHGTTAELAGWATKLGNKTATTQDVRIAVLSSAEYFTLTGGTNTLYIQQMFRDVFRRNVDASGLAYWTGQLSAGKTRTNVATRFMAEPEGRRKIIGDIYLRFLRRNPSTSEATGWVNQLAGGKTEVDVGIGLVSSTEYFNRPAS